MLVYFSASIRIFIECLRCNIHLFQDHTSRSLAVLMVTLKNKDLKLDADFSIETYCLEVRKISKHFIA